jgi:hypothetical protein
MGSGAVIYVPSFIKIGSGIRKLTGGGGGGAHKKQGYNKNQLLFFKNKEIRLKIF